MSSILTNAGAISALHTLRSINSDMVRVQDQFATGLRVNRAPDNAAYWSIATTMRSDNKALSAVGDSIAIGQAILDTAYQGMDGVRTHLEALKNNLITARDLPLSTSTGAPLSFSDFMRAFEGSTLAKIDAEIDQHAAATWTIAKSSSFNGVNLLVNSYDDTETSYSHLDFVVGYADGAVQTARIDRADTTLYNANLQNFPAGALGTMGLLDAAITYPGHYYSLPPLKYHLYNGIGQTEPLGPSTSLLATIEFNVQNDPALRASRYDEAISSLDGTIERLVDRMATIAAFTSSLKAYDAFNQKRSDALEKGVGQLVDADMNETSTRLKALQAQEQLGIQALQIANTTPQAILQLFR